ncbi:MAG TPA: carbon-nitrogen hydrolase family protein [Acidimicrobiales bacterium]|nr:carbon-nitrogen hydrolase family protein [Acidimicrobiales bacterium]
MGADAAGTTLAVATCQFAVGADVRANRDSVVRQLREASRRGAHVAHFPEGALSGYAGADLASFDGFDWEGLRAATLDVMAAARAFRIWVVVGSAHPLSASRKPHNSAYVVDDGGVLVDRYDKRFCAGPVTEDDGDLAHYTPGDHPTVVEIRGVRCGVLICHDYRYPELYREYKRLGVELVFHSYHAANQPPERIAAIEDAIGRRHLPLNRGGTYPAITMPAARSSGS